MLVYPCGHMHWYTCVHTTVCAYLLHVYMLILANAEVIGKCGHVCAQEYVCICMCIYAHVNVYGPRCMCILHQVFKPSYAH